MINVEIAFYIIAACFITLVVLVVNLSKAFRGMFNLVPPAVQPASTSQFEVHVMDRLTNSMLFSADTFEDAFVRLNEYIGNNPGTLKREQFWFHFGDATGASVALKFGDEHISAHTGGDDESATQT